MADNTAIKNAAGSTVSAATDELSDSSQSPKVTLLDGSGSPTPISPATSGRQDTGNTALAALVLALADPATEAKQDAIITALGSLGTQTTLAAILAKIIAAPATEAKQDKIVPASSGEAVTKSDSTVLTATRALWVGGAGDLVVTIGGSDLTFTGVPAGTLLPIEVTKVKNATTATNIVALR